MSKTDNSTTLEWVGLCIAVSAILILVSMGMMPLISNPETLQNDRALLEVVRGDSLHLVSHYLMLLGFCGLSAGTIGISANALGWLYPGHGTPPAESGGDRMIALLMLAAVPLFGAVAIQFLLMDGPVLRILATRLLESNMNGEELKAAVATAMESNFAHLLWTIMFWSGLIPMAGGLAVRDMAPEVRVTSRALAFFGLVTFLSSLLANGTFVTESILLSEGNEEVAELGMVFALMFGSSGLSTITLAVFGWKIRGIGKSLRPKAPAA